MGEDINFEEHGRDFGTLGGSKDTPDRLSLDYWMACFEFLEVYVDAIGILRVPSLPLRRIFR